jgi:hypothetical protein
MSPAVYDRIGRGDAHHRQPDKRIAARIVALLPDAVVDDAMERLAADVRSGEWARRYDHLLALDTHDVGLRILS